MKYIKLYENFIVDIEHYFVLLLDDDDINIEISEIDFYFYGNNINISIGTPTQRHGFLLSSILDKLYYTFDHLSKEYYICSVEFIIEYRNINIFMSNDPKNNKSLESIFKFASENWSSYKSADEGISMFNREISVLNIIMKKL